MATEIARTEPVSGSTTISTSLSGARTTPDGERRVELTDIVLVVQDGISSVPTTRMKERQATEGIQNKGVNGNATSKCV